MAINLSKFDSKEHLNNVSKIVKRHVDSEEILEQLLSRVGGSKDGQFGTTVTPEKAC